MAWLDGRRFGVALPLAMLLFGCAPAGSEGALADDGGAAVSPDAEVGVESDGLRTGGGVGWIAGLGFHPSGCSLTVLAPNLSVTAAHCIGAEHGYGGDAWFPHSRTRARIWATARHPEWLRVVADPRTATERWTDARAAAVDVAVVRHDVLPASEAPLPLGTRGPSAPDSLRLLSFYRHDRTGASFLGFNVGRADELPAGQTSIGAWTYRMRLRDADACNGDSGGPFLRRRGARWELMSLLGDWITEPSSTAVPGVGCGRDVQGPMLASGVVGDWLRAELRKACRTLPASEPSCAAYR